MGYYTRFSLEWRAMKELPQVSPCKHAKPKGAKFCPECGLATIPESLDDLIGKYIANNEMMRYAMTPTGESSESCKWYDAQDDMATMSKCFPGVLFTLSGEGEEAGDIWKQYFLDGLVQVARAKIVVDEFSQAKLKTPPVKNER